MERVTESELAAWRSFIKAHARIIERIERDLAEQKKVPLTTYDVLIALFEAPDRKLRLGELTKKVVLTKSGLTRLVDRLEREGLLVREKSEEDRRGAYAVLTNLGEVQLRQAWPIYARGIKQYFAAPLSEDAIRQVEESMAVVYKHNNE
ncbi:MarR family transcriptional regulator [Cohnella sp. CFH 77786]|uniref:MarR family winged helix-turn-helix transcriptional regulator n=1 Tax=Cohnella sp. CFH 77786 TaxID=2662265 RepID=UPI001C60E1D2|nr:MarR family transcriptional regulator [Cohnella sp. CFH 77786]MBW5448271.1 MarR family transcriptional regulator [Cohnella sp. CFH 77786]